MDKARQVEQLLRRSRRLPLFVIALTLTVLAAVVAVTTFQLRKGIREQIAGRDGEVLHAVALKYYSEDLEQGLVRPIESADDTLGVVLKSAQLRGVLGVRLFSSKGQFVESFPPFVMENVLANEVFARLKTLQPISRFQPRVEMWKLFYPDEGIETTRAIPLLEVYVPLHAEGGQLAGIAQFLLEGHGIATEYARLDGRLAIQAATAFVAGGAVLTLALAWAFRRINRANRLLAERTENLVRANQELALAAKTSALGAVTAHLIHGLKNPLAGLQNFVSSRGGFSEPVEEADWQQAVASTRRMQAMINQVIGVLHEDQAGTAYEVELTELEEMVRAQVQPAARERGVGFTAVIRADGSLPNRVANLAALILVNLCENAAQATPPGKNVSLAINRNEGRLQFEVRDEGPGFPADTPLFMPCRPSNEGGTGIGLALCKQLANHLDASLELTGSSAAGCVFVLRLPEALKKEKPMATQARL